MFNQEVDETTRQLEDTRLQRAKTVRRLEEKDKDNIFSSAWRNLILIGSATTTTSPPPPPRK